MREQLKGRKIYLGSWFRGFSPSWWGRHDRAAYIMVDRKQRVGIQKEIRTDIYMPSSDLPLPTRSHLLPFTPSV
jgi:hypothetical protein